MEEWRQVLSPRRACAFREQKSDPAVIDRQSLLWRAVCRGRTDCRGPIKIAVKQRLHRGRQLASRRKGLVSSSKSETSKRFP